MAEVEWRPGSFTKNFSWGPPDRGLQELYELIRVGFDGELSDTPRVVFRQRVKNLSRPDYIAINFFLFNRQINGSDHLIADELVYQALSAQHSLRFDRLALFAFNLSLVGIWSGARPYQSRPALWAHHYVADRLGPVHRWDVTKATADDIEKFVESDARYRAAGARKLATNLSYLYRQGKLGALSSKKVERWWVDALFLALDRSIQFRIARGLPVNIDSYYSYLVATDFFGIGGNRSIEKELASKHLVELYIACGGIDRFDSDQVRERTKIILNEIENYAVNNPDPIGAIHPTNLRILKSLPRVCAMLARSVGFEVFDVDDLENLDISQLARDNINRALIQLREQGISPQISSDDLMKILREP